MAEEFRVLRPREYHSQLVAKGQRVDGRKLEEIREVRLETDAIRTADSSSLVKLGNTSIVCGCTSRVVPSSNMDDLSDYIDPVRVRIEVPPICSNSKIKTTTHLLTRTIRHIIHDCYLFDNDNFKIDEIDHKWLVEVEVICLNYDGCLLDASIIGVLSALKNLVLTSNSINVQSRPFELNKLPICSTFAIINDLIICDPNLEEEEVAQSSFCITTDGHNGTLYNINKLGGKSINTETLKKCIQLARNHATHRRLSILDQWKSKTMDTS